MKRNKDYPLPLYFIGEVVRDKNNKFGNFKRDCYLFLTDFENPYECYAVAYFVNGKWLKAKVKNLENEILESDDVLVSKIANLYEYMDLKFDKELFNYSLVPSDAYNIFESIREKIDMEKKKIK